MASVNAVFRMSCLVLLATMVNAATSASPTSAWLSVALDGAIRVDAEAAPTAPEFIVRSYDDDGVDVTVRLAGFQLTEQATAAGAFVQISCPETPVDGETGGPALPVVRRLFGAPLGASVVVDFQDGRLANVDLGGLGFSAPIAPMQGPLSIAPAVAGAPYAGDQALESAPLPLSLLTHGVRFDESLYAGEAFLPSEPVKITRLGVSRGMQLYLLEVCPIAYSPARGELVVKQRIDVSLSFDRDPSVISTVKPTGSVSKIVINPPRNASRGADNFLIIAAPDFVGSAPLTQFADAKTAQGFTVTTYTPVAGTTRDAIKSHIQSLWGTAEAPDYIMIAGDAITTTSVSGPMSIPVWLGGGSKHAPTDIPYACMDGGDDWLPDIAIGRIPVRYVSYLQRVVDKILSVENETFADPSYTKRAVFMASGDPDADAEAVQDYIIDTHMTPAGIQSNKLYAVTYGADTQDVSDAFNSGCFLATYYGHADGMQSWWSPYFNVANVDALTNEDLYPFIVSFSCSCSRFDLTGTGFLEWWMQVEGKGAAATYGTTTNLNPYSWSAWNDLYKFLMETIYTDGVREVGAASQAAATKLVTLYGAEDPVCRDHAESFLIFGDPSMRLPEPPDENYLIVTAEDYAGSAPLNEFIAAKEAKGFNVQTYTASSGTSNTTIKTYIQSLWGTSDAPDYILLVGDTDGFTAASDSIPYWDGGGDKHAATDWPYGCMDAGDDWYPDIAVGRFSVRTVSSLQDVVDKTLFVEAGVFSDPDYVKRGAFLANGSTYGQAEPTHDWVIDTYFTPNDYEGIKLYAAQGADTSDVTAAVNNGALFTLYFGHSGATSGWWDPSFGSSDVNALSNAGLYGLAFGWSCDTSHYTYDECFGETWLRAPNKGAAAYISASAYIYWGSVEAWAPSVSLEKAFFTSIFEDGNWKIGPAWMAGLYRFLADHGGWDGDPAHLPTQNAAQCRNFFEEFVILGDPSLQLPRPDGFTLTPSPDSADLCSPPDDQAVYTINVGRLGSFAESITLSASDLPTGAVVVFSHNGQAPPFASTMTISNLAGAPEGEYDIIVTGTSASDQNSTTVRLTISNDVPGAVVLKSPDNGATGVGRQPTLTWLLASGAWNYDLQVATDAGFTSIVYSQTVTDTTHQVATQLESDVEHYWRVRASNGCGDSDYSTPFSFTTIDQADYFTEEFTGGGDSFDLEDLTIAFIPNGSGSYYRMCADAAAGLPTDPSGGTVLSISEDSYRTVNLQGGDPVLLYGKQYSTFYVNDNGNITFTGGDSTWTESLSQHFTMPRIAPLFDDLSVPQGGTVRWQEFADRAVVTFENVPGWGESNQNTFQVEMFYNGEIHITWLSIDSSDGIVGLSAGGGVPGDYIEADLSAAGSCFTYGACCLGEKCLIMTEVECLNAGGVYNGDDTDCDPNPCVEYSSDCLIISEIVQGTASGGCPRWIEITNTGLTDFAFLEGGVIVQIDGSNDVVVDVDLTDVVIPAGYSYVINSNVGGVCTGAFYAIYEVDADLYTNVSFGFGNERFILTDTADGSNLIDAYGEFGVNGVGQEWEFTNGYSYRLPEWNGAFAEFMPNQWSFGGVDSLSGDNPTQLLLDLTTPGVHVYNEKCIPGIVGDVDGDDDVDLSDLSELLAAYGACAGDAAYDQDADFDGDGCIGLSDLAMLLANFGVGT